MTTDEILDQVLIPRRNLHSPEDSRDRLSVAALERSTEFLHALVRRIDTDPSRLHGLEN